MEKILVTGGAGFIGSNFIKYALRETDYSVVNLDALTYAGNLENLQDVENSPRYKFVCGKIQNSELVKHICVENKIDGIINFAAESHVDRSILDAQPFIDANVGGVSTLLQIVRQLNIKRFLQVSTDEVYGSLGPTGKFSETSPIQPNSPYSASKASADLLVNSFYQTYGTPVLITRCSNNYGPYQFPEKLIPLMISNALEDKPLPVYGDGLNVRDWIHTLDHCKAIAAVFERGETGEVYNIGADCEKTNIEIVKSILSALGKPESLIKFVKDRLGHDRRYAIDSSKIAEKLEWRPEIGFEDGLEQTIKWYVDNAEWTSRLKSGEYLKYYEKNYSL